MRSVILAARGHRVSPSHSQTISYVHPSFYEITTSLNDRYRNPHGHSIDRKGDRMLRCSWESLRCFFCDWWRRAGCFFCELSQWAACYFLPIAVRCCGQLIHGRCSKSNVFTPIFCSSTERRSLPGKVMLIFLALVWVFWTDGLLFLLMLVCTVAPSISFKKSALTIAGWTLSMWIFCMVSCTSSFPACLLHRNDIVGNW